MGVTTIAGSILDNAGRRAAGVLLGGLLLAAVLLAPGPAAADAETWVRVDTRAATLSVLRGERVVARFPGVSIGRGGASRQRTAGDQRTPLGEFRIVKVREQSHFHRFFMIDYPDEQRAGLALRQGLIDEQTYHAIRKALRAGKIPPQDTPLGGHLGIHGLGRGDPQIHESFHWTNGCVALTNEQIDRLARWLRVGTRVVID